MCMLIVREEIETFMSTDLQSQPPPAGGPMSVAEYLKLDRSIRGTRYEYVNGVARLALDGTFEHHQIALRIFVALDEQFRSSPFSVLGPNVRTIITSADSGQEHYLYPDLKVRCDDARRRCVPGRHEVLRSPCLVLEILSPASENFDRVEKFKLYQSDTGIQEIVLVSRLTPHIEVYRRADQYAVDTTEWNCVFYGPGEILELTSVHARIPVNEIYNYIRSEEDRE